MRSTSLYLYTTLFEVAAVAGVCYLWLHVVVALARASLRVSMVNETCWLLFGTLQCPVMCAVLCAELCGWAFGSGRPPHLLRRLVAAHIFAGCLGWCYVCRGSCPLMMCGQRPNVSRQLTCWLQTHVFVVSSVQCSD